MINEFTVEGVLKSKVVGEAVGQYLISKFVLAQKGYKNAEVCIEISMFGDEGVNNATHLEIGRQYKVSGTVKSRQSGERYFTSLTAKEIVELSKPGKKPAQTIQHEEDVSF